MTKTVEVRDLARPPGPPGASRQAGTARGPRAARKKRNVLLWLCMAWTVLALGCAIASLFIPDSAYAQAVGAPQIPPFTDWSAPLGTDSFGRDVLVRLMAGAKASLFIGVAAAAMGMLVGGALGLLAGYVRGWVDSVVSFLVDAALAFPPLVFLLMLMSVRPRTVLTVLIGLTVLIIPTFVRLQRASTLSWRERPFVLAARSYGASHTRIAVHEVLPNAVLSVISFVPTVIAVLIVAEGSLSFLGLGVPPPQPSWGGMIADGKSRLDEAPQLVLVPALVVFFTVFAFNVIGEWVRAKFEGGRP